MKKLFAVRAEESDLKKWRDWAEKSGLPFSSWVRARLNANHQAGCNCEACRGTLKK